MEQVTIREIAKLCGVGVSTVSRAINNHPDINEETKNRIMEVIKEYNYVPNNSARNLKRSASRTIAVLVKGISNPYFGLIIQRLEREIIKQNYSFVLQQVEEEENEIEVAIQLEKEKRLKGIIFLGGMYHHDPEQLQQLTVPFVIATVDMDVPQGTTGCAVVSIDNEQESYRMVDYLCGLGHKRIAILTALRGDESIGKRRLSGYRRALEKHGIAYDETLVIPTQTENQTYTIENGYRMTRQLLDDRKDLTCIYAISDTMAIGAAKAVIDKGLRVPEDISIAGFDGLDVAKYYNPSLTTIVQPRDQMAREAVKLLFDLIRGRKVQQRAIFDADLYEGQSTRSVDAGPDG